MKTFRFFRRIGSGPGAKPKVCEELLHVLIANNTVNPCCIHGLFPPQYPQYATIDHPRELDIGCLLRVQSSGSIIPLQMLHCLLLQ